MTREIFMFQQKSKLFLVGSASLCLALCLALPGEADQAGTPGLTIESEGNSVHVKLVTRELRLEQASLGSSPWIRPVVRDYEHGTIHEPGHPMLPVEVALIEVPLNAAISYNLEGIETSVRRTGPVVPVPARPVHDVQREIGFDLPQEYRSILDKKDNTPAPSIYNSNIPYPEEPVRIVEVGIMRGKRYAQILLHPVQYKPAEGTLLLHNRISLTVTFEETAGSKHATRAAAKLPFPGYGEIDAYRVEMSATGMAEITYADLDGAGLDLATVDPDYFQVYNMGQEVAIRVSAQGGVEGSFGTGDTIRFYAQKNQTVYPGTPTTKYTDVNLYWLIVGDAPGLRMAEHDGTPSGGGTTPGEFSTTVHAEENLYNQSDIALEDDEDNWFWGIMSPESYYPSDTYTIDLPHVSTAEGDDAQLALHLWGLTNDPDVDPDHHVQIYVNEYLVTDDVFFEGLSSYLAIINDVPQDVLVEGPNDIRVAMPGDTGAEYDVIYLDYIRITYRKAFDADLDVLACSTDVTGVTNRIEIDGFSTSEVKVYNITSAGDPVAVINPLIQDQGGSYRVIFDDDPAEETEYYAVGEGAWLNADSIELDSPSALWGTSNQADYIVITHESLLSEAAQLAAYRESKGMTVELVDVADVYDEFNYGIFNPDAIRDFLAYAYAEWATPSPAYALLFGDGHLDYKDYLGYGAPILIPPRMIRIFDDVVASDNYFACVDGDDDLPDILLGRLPVNTPTEAQTVIDKITGYESDPDSSDFDDQVLMIADNDDFFQLRSDELIDDFICPPHEATTVYVNDYPIDPNPPYHCPLCRQAIIDGINGGKVLVNYRGHGSPSVLASEGIFYNYDVESLTNIDTLPIIFSGTCLDGDFSSPYPTSGHYGIGEELVRDPDGGSVAGVHASGFSFDTSSYQLNRGLFHYFFNVNLRNLGDVIQGAKLYFLDHSADVDVLRYNLLLGDPALHIVESAFDTDADGWTDNEDNCPDDYDPDQANSDEDCMGDACDCGPLDPDIHPGAVENCANGKDDDCDDYVDAQDPDCCDDLDGDFYTDATCGGTDCDDSDPDVNPGIEESVIAVNCADGVDNDCDGLIDTDPQCYGGSGSNGGGCGCATFNEGEDPALLQLILIGVLYSLPVGLTGLIRRRVLSSRDPLQRVPR